MKKRRSISLIEVLICLTLFSFLIGSLTFWYHSFYRQKETFQALKWPLMEERYALERLQSIIPQACSPFFSMDDNNSLVFVFNRGPWMEPKIAGTVLARLYHDAQNEALCLKIWPDPSKYEEKEPSQTFVLLDKISALKWEFYPPPDPFRKPVDPEEVGRALPQTGWQDSWDAEFSKLPALVRLKITRNIPGCKNKWELNYLFDLPVPIIFAEAAVK